jgi:hypothetical protein
MLDKDVLYSLKNDTLNGVAVFRQFALENESISGKAEKIFKQIPESISFQYHLLRENQLLDEFKNNHRIALFKLAFSLFTRKLRSYCLLITEIKADIGEKGKVLQIKNFDECLYFLSNNISNELISWLPYFSTLEKLNQMLHDSKNETRIEHFETKGLRTIDGLHIDELHSRIYLESNFIWCFLNNCHLFIAQLFAIKMTSDAGKDRNS